MSRQSRELFLKTVVHLMFAAVLAALTPVDAMATEEASYEVLTQDGKFEIRQYASHILAETVVEADLEDAGSQAFNRLFGYKSGENSTSDKVAMTAPVSQQPAGEKIAMTAPVGQQRAGDNWAVSFMMPSEYSLETLPEPNDPLITLRQVPPRTMAAVRYSGFWSEKNYRKYKAELEAWISTQGLVISGDPVWARYNAPFTPWFLRRNEILFPVEGEGGGQ
jgi:hypothetical protein